MFHLGMAWLPKCMAQHPIQVEESFVFDHVPLSNKVISQRCVLLSWRKI